MISFLQIIKSSFDNIYQQNDDRIFNSEDEDSLLSRFAAFIEIPNWRENSEKGFYYLSEDGLWEYCSSLEKQTWGNLGKKFFGWQDNVSTAKKIRNVFLAIFFFVPINLATVLIRTPINIIRLFTEFLPSIVTRATYFKLKDITRLEKKTPGAIILGVFLGLLHALGALMMLASRSITNPIRALKTAWHVYLAYPFIKDKKLQVLISVVLSAATLAFSLIGFTLLAGIPAIQAGIAALLPYAVSALPQVMAGLSAVGVFTAKVVSALLGFIPMAGEFLAASVAAMPALSGIAGLTAVLMPTLGNVISPKIIDFQANWYAPSAKKKNPGAVEVAEEQKGSDSLSYKQVHHKGVSLTSSRPDAGKPLKLEEFTSSSRVAGVSGDGLSQVPEASPSKESVAKTSAFKFSPTQ